ncbi:MAG: outer membrane porin, OprD family, partial [Oceanospirillaceae bacterium]|nr:outer membrane porin, OprD family [Oceanospirillaceae bacterium]
MKLKKLTVAVMALSALSSAQVIAADTDDKMQVNLGLRTFYMNRDFDAGIPDTIAAGQAFRAEFLSPFWNDMIGVDASVVHVAKLEGDKTVNSSDVLTTSGDGYTTLEQAYIKIKPTENLNIRAGRMIL